MVMDIQVLEPPNSHLPGDGPFPGSGVRSSGCLKDPEPAKKARGDPNGILPYFTGSFSREDGLRQADANQGDGVTLSAGRGTCNAPLISRPGLKQARCPPPRAPPHRGEGF
jgi:hypothetical protein